MNLLWLGDPKSFDAALVGGKAANLSRLARAYHRVPDGFCIPATVLHELHPSDLYDEVATAVAGLMACHGVAELVTAVRSSAVDEDSADASFAGQHETYLNIIGVEAIVQAIAKCWESAHSERAMAYRHQQGLDSEQPQIGVLVQQLVVADSSAVVFSANPVTSKRDEVMINASWGLGDSIGRGTVTPDTFIVNKPNQTITSHIIADKQRMTVATPGGTSEVNMPHFLRSQPSLNDDQVLEMAQLALTLEQLMGYAVDIECAYADGKLYLLQCRPITTLLH